MDNPRQLTLSLTLLPPCSPPAGQNQTGSCWAGSPQTSLLWHTGRSRKAKEGLKGQSEDTSRIEQGSMMALKCTIGGPEREVLPGVGNTSAGI